MTRQTVQEYGPDGALLSEHTVEIPDPPTDPIEQLQAQVDALTDIVLGGVA